MAIFKFKEPLVISSGTGFIVTPDNTELDATSKGQSLTFSIGQGVNSSSNVTFGNLNATSKIIIIDDEELVLSGNVISGSFTHTGTFTISNNLNVSKSMTVEGKVTAEQIQSELSQSTTIFKSGSTQFGNTSDDIHRVSGSLQVSNSIVLNNHAVNTISNTLSSATSTALTTENAVYAYVGETDSKRTYLRKSFAHTGSFVNASTASFTAITASAPSGMTTTSEDDFMFFNNGMMMEHDALNVKQSGSKFYLSVNNNSIGYDLQNTDEFLAWGKFNS